MHFHLAYGRTCVFNYTLHVSLPVLGHIGKTSTMEKVRSSKNQKWFFLEHLERRFRAKNLQFISVLWLPFWCFRIIYLGIFHSFWFPTRKEFWILFEILVTNHVCIPWKVCTKLGNSYEDRVSLRVSLVLVLIGLTGLYTEIINAFEYMQGARRCYFQFHKLIL